MASVPPILAFFLWPLLISLPLYLTTNDNYKLHFQSEWYDATPPSESVVEWPSPLGLSLGILAVIIGQIATLIYHWLHVRTFVFGAVKSVQRSGAEDHNFWRECVDHLSQPEGFVLLGLYLSGTWMFRLMPPSYYAFEGGIQWGAVAVQLLLQDTIQSAMHLLEHKVDDLLGTRKWFYRRSHKPHHRFTNPKLFDAFNGSGPDTFCMILVPLFLTAHLVHTNVWSYMAFGSLYANWLCLIHSECDHPWDGVFTALGFGTAGDHHVHHTLFTWNYGHLFTYADRVCQTYKAPSNVSKFSAYPSSMPASSSISPSLDKHTTLKAA
jgi:lathosterol oxidase